MVQKNPRFGMTRIVHIVLGKQIQPYLRVGHRIHDTADLCSNLGCFGCNRASICLAKDKRKLVEVGQDSFIDSKAHRVWSWKKQLKNHQIGSGDDS